MGDHALGCPKTSDRIARHNLLRDVLFDSAVSAALGPVREEKSLLPGRAARPGDIFLRHWSGGKDCAWDVTVANSLAPSHVAGAAAEAGSALRKACEKKVNGAAEACREQGIVFLPLAVEGNTWGPPQDSGAADEAAGGCPGQTHRSGRVNRHLPPVPEVLPQLDARERRHDDNPEPR